MAPTRLIRGEINSSASLSRVSRDAELTFRALLTAADDYGRLDGRPAALKAALFPIRDDVLPADVERWVDELVAEGCVERYQHAGRPFLALTSWELHRGKGKRAARSRYPDPPRESAEVRGEPRESARLTSDVGRLTSDVGRRTLDGGPGETDPAPPAPPGANAPEGSRGKRSEGPPDWTEAPARLLAETVRRRWPGAAVPASLTPWRRELARLTADPADVAQVLGWYCAAERDGDGSRGVAPYTPEVRCGRTARAKWTALLAARERARARGDAQSPEEFREQVEIERRRMRGEHVQ